MYDLVYYCDSFPAIGMGHLARGVDILNAIGGKHSSSKLGLTGTFSASAENFIELFLKSGIDWLEPGKSFASKQTVVDTMFDSQDAGVVDEKICARLKQASEKLIFVSSALEINLPNCVDVFIDHLPDVKFSSKNPRLRTHLGFDYAPVHSGVAPVPFGSNEKIVMVIGGNDDQYGARKFLEVWTEGIGGTEELILLLSPHFPEEEKKRLQADFAGVDLRQNVPDVYDLLKNAKLAIVTYGNIVYHALACHLPVFCLSYKDFQVKYADYLEEKGLVNNLGAFADLTPERLACIRNQKLLQTLSANAGRVFRNPGIENIINAILSCT